MVYKYNTGEPNSDGFLIDKYNLMVYGFKNIVEKDVKYWASHSMEKEQDLDLIMLEALIGEEFGVSLICYIYILNHCVYFLHNVLFGK